MRAVGPVAPDAVWLYREPRIFEEYRRWRRPGWARAIAWWIAARMVKSALHSGRGVSGGG